LWYLCSSTSSITDAIISYDNDFQAEEFYARPPNPAYTKNIKIQSSKPVYDVRYHLLKLYSKRSHPIESLLNPATHTPDAMDYRLSFLLLQTLDTLGYHHCSELSRAQIYTSFADQLENYGLWHWSIYILLHIKDQRRRELCVQQILYRYIDLSKDPEYLEKEKFIIEKLQVPAKWMYWAKAVKAGSNRNYHQQAKYLLCAKQWSLAHKIIMQHIAPDAIINGKCWPLLLFFYED
jgi:nuclear pore complex protein Nup98-Nup96